MLAMETAEKLPPHLRWPLQRAGEFLEHGGAGSPWPRQADDSIELATQFLLTLVPADHAARMPLAYLADAVRHANQAARRDQPYDGMHALTAVGLAGEHLLRKPLSVTLVRDQGQLAAVAAGLQVGDWHEPDQQDVTAVVTPGSLDNASPGSYLHQHVVLSQEDHPRALVNLADLLAWAAARPADAAMPAV